MTYEQIQQELRKCKESPYYFAHKYLTVKNNVGEEFPFTTLLSEEEFNKMFENLCKNETTVNKAYGRTLHFDR
jgi:hypothetical protein